MARRRRSSSRGYSSRRSFSRGSRRNTGRSFRGRSRGAARAQTVRLVIEQPAHNPVQRPGIPGLIGVAQADTSPRKAMF